ncbi:MAG: DUF6502 family protein, partial [Wenzhouxiangellaceae bacterium]
MHAELKGEYSNAPFVVASVYRIFRPIIRLLVGRVTCSFLNQVIREIYIEEARDHLERRGDKVTKASLALLTGIDSRTVDNVEQNRKRLREGPEYSAESFILSRWRTDPDYLDEQGNPAVLPIGGRGPTFSRLVSQCAGRNVTTPLLLNILVDSGNIEVVNDTHVRVVDSKYRAVSGDEKAILDSGFLAINRLSHVVVHNLENRDKRLLQQDRWSIRIPPEKLPKVKALCRASTERHIQEIYDILAEHESSELTPQGMSFGVGWYHWAHQSP